MKVILLQGIDKLGKQYEVKEVSGGYARNYLIPRGLAKTFSQENLDWATKKQIVKEQKAAEGLKKIGKMAAEMDGLEVELAIKVGDKGQFFEKINAQKVASRLQELGYEINKDQVELEKEIKDLGEFEAKVKFDHGLEVNIKVIVVASN